jgi:hypothetical protein
MRLNGRKRLTCDSKKDPWGGNCSRRKVYGIVKSIELWPLYRCDYTSSTITKLAQCRNVTKASTDVCYNYDFKPMHLCKDWTIKTR